MAHYPINHALRPFYRVLTFLIGAYILVFGVIGVGRTWGHPLFERGSVWVLGLRTNLAFSLLSVLIGAFVLACAALGGRLFHFPLIVVGWIFLAGGIAALLIVRTDVNILNFSVSNVIASMSFGLIFVTAGMYGQMGQGAAREAEEDVRHSAAAKRPSAEGRAAG